MINIGFLGFGTVGRATYEILNERKEIIEKAINNKFEVKKILVRDVNKYKDISQLITTNISDLVDDKDIDLLIEVTGEVDGLIREIEKALYNKKNIITANKALVSKYFGRLHTLSKENNTKFKYEASVGGAIPIISQIDKIITLNDVKEISGVLNGTCNFILSEMEKGNSYEDSLKKAQELGFAEANPSADVDGIDTKRKLRILSTLFFDNSIIEEDIECKGITNLTIEDIFNASKENKRYKLIAKANKFGEYSVKPELVDKNSILGSLVNGENAIIIKTSNAKDIILKGMGAGGRETAYSVLSDFLDMYKYN